MLIYSCLCLERKIKKQLKLRVNKCLVQSTKIDWKFAVWEGHYFEERLLVICLHCPRIYLAAVTEIVTENRCPLWTETHSFQSSLLGLTREKKISTGWKWGFKEAIDNANYSVFNEKKLRERNSSPKSKAECWENYTVVLKYFEKMSFMRHKSLSLHFLTQNRNVSQDEKMASENFKQINEKTVDSSSHKASNNLPPFIPNLLKVLLNYAIYIVHTVHLYCHINDVLIVVCSGLLDYNAFIPNDTLLSVGWSNLVTSPKEL